LQKLFTNYKITTVFIQADSLTVGEQQIFFNSEVKTKEFDQDELWKLRLIKSKQEIEDINKAGQIATQALEETLKSLHAGMTENQVKKLIIKKIYELNGEGEAFPTIVAFGAHSALPHHQPTAHRLQPNTPVLIDLGAKFNGYCSDMTRTIWFGDQPSEKFKKIESIIRAAYHNVEAQFRPKADPPRVEIAPLPNTTAAKLDHAARKVINAAGFGDKFIHTTGHGIGLEVHEPPSLNSRNKMKLEPGMVITIEPGIYLPGEFGYRFENTIEIKTNNFKLLTD